MNIINNQEALQIIKDMGIVYVIEVDSLNCLIEDGNVECLVSDDMLVTVAPKRDLIYLTVIPLNDTFNIDELLLFTKESSQKVSLLINISILTEEFVKLLDEKLKCSFNYEYKLIDYFHRNRVALEMDGDIRLLDAEDKADFVACSREQIKYRPPLAVLFDVFVNRRQGQILAAFDNDKIVGYLSFITISDKVYDVDYVYVIPEMRGRGFGKKLASAYVSYAQSHGCIAY